MPRGVPKAGFRVMTQKPGPKPKSASSSSEQAISYLADKMATPTFVETTETDEQIDAKLHERFEILDKMTANAISGSVRSLILSGPGGVGKSFNVEAALAAWDPTETMYTIVKGFLRATALYKTLYDNRHKGSVVVFDDADAVFYDKDTLGLLKAVCDTTERRRVFWGAETRMVSDKDAEILPTNFIFDGTIIFISNIDFDVLIARGHGLAPHLEALISRSHYIDLAMKSKRDYLIRIKQVVKQGLLDHLTPQQGKDVIAFIEANSDTLRELSLRMAIKLGHLRSSSATDWARIAKITCCRNAK